MTAKTNKPSILLVDDDSLWRETLNVILGSGDFNIVGEASNGEAALSMCRQHAPGVVLLDINMPGMDGIAVLQAIRKEFPAVSVIMISAEATLDRVKEAIAEGASGFVVKPFNSGRVIDDVNAVIRRRK